MRLIAIDLGDKRTGLASGDVVTRSALPLDVIEVPIATRDGTALLEALARVIEEQLGQAVGAGGRGWSKGAAATGELVLGLPLNMDGSEGPPAKRVRAFGARLEARTRRKVNFQDERLTSAAADWAMARTGLTRGEKKDLRDAIAAATILKDYLATLDARGLPEEGGHGPKNGDGGGPAR